MSIAFVAGQGFDDFALLSRGFGIALEGEVAKGNSKVEVYAMDNARLQSLLLQLVDSTHDFLSQKGISVLATARPASDVTTIVSFGKLNYYPHKTFVKRAKADSSITVLEY